MLTFSKVTLGDLRYSKEANCDYKSNVSSSKVNARLGAGNACRLVIARS